jgi:hypothetical protein
VSKEELGPQGTPLAAQNVQVPPAKKQVLRFAQDDNSVENEVLRFAQDDNSVENEVLRFAQDDTFLIRTAGEEIHDYTHTVGGGSGYSFASGID